MTKHTQQRRPLLLALLLSAVAVLVTACASLPESSAPQSLGTVERQAATTEPDTPALGREPDLLIRDFIKASTNPANHHQSARQYLTPAAAAGWDDDAGTVIVERLDVLPESRTPAAATYTVRASRSATLSDGGRFQAAEGEYSERMTLVQVDGQWRIDQLPQGVVLDRTQFLNAYSHKMLYFVDPTGTMLVPDPRWVPGGQDQIAARLVTMLLDGPRPQLAGALGSRLTGATLREPLTKADGRSGGVGVGLGGVRIDLHAPVPTDQDAITQLAAQVVWTLSGADIAGPYVIQIDGRPIDPRFTDGYTTADLAAFAPTRSADADSTLYALREGSVVAVRDAAVSPLPGVFGTSGRFESASISQSGALIAAVERVDGSEDRRLRLGQTATGESVRVLDAPVLGRPSWAPHESALWFTVGGSDVRRAAIDATGRGIASIDAVNTLAIAPLGAIDDLRISPDGTRSALIIGGQLYLTTVVQNPAGGWLLDQPRKVAPNLGSRAISVDWTDRATLVVARDDNDGPVVAVAVDGSRLGPLPSRNLTTPVVSVDAGPQTIVIADSRAVFGLNTADPDSDQYWREIPGLTGIRAIPLLPG